MVRCPILEVGQPEQALFLAKGVYVENYRENFEFLAVEGAATLALGRAKEAVTALAKACRLREPPLCRDKFLLAMAQAAARDQAKARQSLVLAEKLRAEQCPAHWETAQLAAESREAVEQVSKK